MKNLLAKRIIPCLDVKDGRVVKGVNFVGLRDAGDPVELAKFYSQEGADEIVFLDITATSDNRDTIADVVRRTCREVFVPVTVGGGIPVVCRDGKLYGTPAVIDKDFASAKLAELLDADMLVILTAVEKVAINFGKPDQKGLDTLTPDEARKYIDEKQFAPGSMLPKVQAAMSFAESKPGRVALITLLEKAAEGIEGKTGTRVQM